jgi:hypothetical protein
MTHYATTYLTVCSCSLKDHPVTFSPEDHREFARRLNNGENVQNIYIDIVGKKYDPTKYKVRSIADVRICCQNTLFTGHGELSAFPQSIGSPEDLVRTTDFNPISEVMTVDSHDYIGEEDPFLDIHSTPLTMNDREAPTTSENSDVKVSGFVLDRNGKPIRVDVGSKLTVRVLNINSDIFSSVRY